jgi:hypothetical protein
MISDEDFSNSGSPRSMREWSSNQRALEVWLVIICPNRVAAPRLIGGLLEGAPSDKFARMEPPSLSRKFAQLSTSEGDVPFGVRHSGTVGDVLDSAGDAASHIYRLGSAFAGHEKVSGSHACLD